LCVFQSTVFAVDAPAAARLNTLFFFLQTAFDILTPGPSIRQRQGRLHQPADLREGLSNAVYAVRRGVHHLTYDLQMPVVADPQKGSVGAIGDVLPNILGGLRNQLRPEAKREDEEKWKCTQGL
uniref:E3 ubiquitin-protein ligase n=1 Tax=Mesocestoides corti TaxID=53468 RepID=A0A0R3U536_MESCO